MGRVSPELAYPSSLLYHCFLFAIESFFKSMSNTTYMNDMTTEQSLTDRLLQAFQTMDLDLQNTA